jgi:L-ascorbate metabolism protein UlaG (beta-lactamase superfamily)
MEYHGLKINWLGHSGFKIDAGIKIYIDPFKIKDDEKADIILITHSHYDHCSLEDIGKIVKKDTIVLGPVDIQSKLGKISSDLKFQMLHPGQGISVKGISISAYPAYNLNKAFHPKSNNWLAFLLDINGVKIFHAGDSDAVPEFMSLKGVDILLIPIGGTYTMDAKEAAQLCNEIMPKIAIPMHFGSIVGKADDAVRFKGLCRCDGRIL